LVARNRPLLHPGTPLGVAVTPADFVWRSGDLRRKFLVPQTPDQRDRPADIVVVAATIRAMCEVGSERAALRGSHRTLEVIGRRRPHTLARGRSGQIIGGSVALHGMTSTTRTIIGFDEH
jgi:hypothetical protein